MTKEVFIQKFSDILQTEEEISLNSSLAELEDWDSLTTMAVVSALLENGKKITVKEIANCQTVGDIAKFFGVE